MTLFMLFLLLASEKGTFCAMVKGIGATRTVPLIHIIEKTSVEHYCFFSS